MEEIVVALRETRRDASRMPPFSVVEGRPSGNWASAVALRAGEAATARRNGDGGIAQNATDWSDIAALRDAEIERLLADNARLNERIVFLLKVIEREQRRNADLAGDHLGETNRGVVSDVKAALEAELRPILLVLLRLLEKQHADPAASVPTAADTCRDVARSNVPGSTFWGAAGADRRRDR